MNDLNDLSELKQKIQELLGQHIIQFSLKAKGAVNNAYYIETEKEKYIVKQEREIKEFQPQNSLLVEAKIAKVLYETNLSVPMPHVVFVSENPAMYGYEYLEGDLMIDIWSSLNEVERIYICNLLGQFHAEIGKKITKEISLASGIKINESAGLHPEVLKDYERLSIDSKVPNEFKELVKKAKNIFDKTFDKVIFQFIHNDAHHENVLIKDKKISGIIDFGEAEYGEVAKEFSRYIRDYPDYFQYIVRTYEEKSGNKLSYERLVSNALLSGFVDNVEDYLKGGEEREKAEKAIETCRKLLDKVNLQK